MKPLFALMNRMNTVVVDTLCHGLDELKDDKTKVAVLDYMVDWFGGAKSYIQTTEKLSLQLKSKIKAAAIEFGEVDKVITNLEKTLIQELKDERAQASDTDAWK